MPHVSQSCPHRVECVACLKIKNQNGLHPLPATCLRLRRHLPASPLAPACASAGTCSSGMEQVEHAAEEVLGWHGYKLASPGTETAALLGMCVAVTMSALLVCTIVYILYVVCIEGEKGQVRWKEE